MVFNLEPKFRDDKRMSLALVVLRDDWTSTKERRMKVFDQLI